MKRDEQHWEPDVRKGLDDLKKMPDKKRELEEAFARRKIDGFNPGDSRQDRRK